MTWVNGSAMRRVFSVALLALFLSCFLSSPAQAQSSIQTSLKLDPITMQAQPLWLTLESLVATLPQELDSFMANLQSQTDLLQANMINLQETNSQLQINNLSSTQANEQLQASLQASQVLVETSGQKLAQLQTDLDTSRLSISLVEADLAKAQGDAKAIAGWNTFWKVTTGLGILGTVAAVVWALAKP
jgi:chromosome segregation ATPase